MFLWLIPGIIPPRPKTTTKRNKGAKKTPKRAHRKAAKNVEASAAIQQDLDTEEEFTGEETGRRMTSHGQQAGFDDEHDFGLG